MFSNGLPFAAWSEFPFCGTLVLSIPSRMFFVLQVYMNVRGAPQKAGTDPREINYDLAEQAARWDAGGPCIKMYKENIEFHDTRWRERHSFWDFTRCSLCWATTKLVLIRCCAEGSRSEIFIPSNCGSTHTLADMTRHDMKPNGRWKWLHMEEIARWHTVTEISSRWHLLSFGKRVFRQVLLRSCQSRMSLLGQQSEPQTLTLQSWYSDI